LIFQDKFPNNFGFSGNFTKKIDFLLNFPKNFDFLDYFKKIDFSGQISLKNCSGNFTKNFDNSGQISEKFRYFRRFHRKFRFNWLFTAISGQIILFPFKSHHFRNTSCTW